MFCTKCGSKLNNGVKYCTNCGEKIVKNDSAYCTVCGGKLNPRNGICMKCTMAKKKNQKVVKTINRDSLKLNLLFNLGIIMVLVAGFVLATTNWSAISNWGKIGLLIGLSVFFMIMHLICEKNLKIKVSAYIYFFLSLAFIMFTGICLTYLQMFGHWFSLAGPGKFLCLAALSLLFTLLSIIPRVKYQKRWLSIFIFIGIALTLFFVCKYFGLGWLSNLAIISLLMLLLYFYTAKTSYCYVTIALSLIIILFDGVFLALIKPEYNFFAGTAITICNGLLLFMFGYLHNNKLVKVLSSITLFTFFLFFLSYCLEGSPWTISVIGGIILLLIIMILIINAINSNNNPKDLFSRTSKICSVISILLLLIVYIGIHKSQYLLGYYFNPLTDIMEYLINITVLSFILVFEDVLFIKEKTTSYSPIYLYFLPVFVIIFSFNLIRLLTKLVPSITFSTCLVFLTIVLLILYLVQKPGLLKKIIHITLYVLLFIVMFAYPIKDNLLIESIDGVFALLFVIMTLVLYFKEKQLNSPKAYRWLSIIIFTVSFIEIIGIKNLFGFSSELSLIITIASLVLLVLLFMDDLVIRRYIPFMLIIPITNLLDLYSLSLVNEIIILNIYSLLVLYLFAKTFSYKVYNVLLIVGTSIILFQPTFFFNVTLSIYASIISILLIIWDLYSKKIRGLYTVGIVYLIINTLIELKYIWSHLSLWTYLLLLGIVIIIITTIKLAKITNKKD